MYTSCVTQSNHFHQFISFVAINDQQNLEIIFKFSFSKNHSNSFELVNSNPCNFTFKQKKINCDTKIVNQVIKEEKKKTNIWKWEFFFCWHFIWTNWKPQYFFSTFLQQFFIFVFYLNRVFNRKKKTLLLNCIKTNPIAFQVEMFNKRK